MITIKPSSTADTRTCDFANTSKETLLISSVNHIRDVTEALRFFKDQLTAAASTHDSDKITKIDWFHENFVTGFKQTGWWDQHRWNSRHHLSAADGVPFNVNLIDILEYISDCVMAGMARSGNVTPLTIDDEVLKRAFHNTVELLKNNVEVQTLK